MTHPIATILCPIDFSETSKAAVAEAIAFAAFHHSRITALHVITRLSLAIHGAAAVSQDDVGMDQLRRLASDEFGAATRRGIGVNVVIGVGQPATTILDRAAEIAADLIVMGTHGTSGFQHLVLGSVTEKVVRKAACAVLPVPPRVRTRSELPFQSVLCPVDFSPPSLNAVRFAPSLSEQSRANVTAARNRVAVGRASRAGDGRGPRRATRRVGGISPLHRRRRQEATDVCDRRVGRSGSHAGQS